MGCGRLNSDRVEQKIGYPTTDTIPVTKLPHQTIPFFKIIYFTESDAERILGEKAHLTDSSSTIKKDTLECKSAYTANSKDQKTGKTGVVYFMIEQYSQVSSAKNAYNSIRVANENHEGVKILQGIGDDAYFHSDGQNFYFILVRKRSKMFRIKVNKITGKTSLNEFNLIAKNISAAL